MYVTIDPARIIVTLVHEMMKRPEAKKGLATLCIGGGIGREVGCDVRAAVFHVVELCQPQPRLFAGAGNEDIVVLRRAEYTHHQVDKACNARGIRPEDARGVDAAQSLEAVVGRRRNASLCRFFVIGRVVEQLIYVGAYEVVHIKYEAVLRHLESLAGAEQGAGHAYQLLRFLK